MRTLYFFDKQNKLKGTCPEPSALLHTEHEYLLKGSFLDGEGAASLYNDLSCGDRLGFTDIDNRFRLFELDVLEWTEPDSTCTFSATDLAVRELMDIVIQDVRPTAKQAGAAFTHFMSGTAWKLGSAVTTGQHSFRIYYESAWSALQKLRSRYSVEFVAYYEFDRNRITGRRVDLLSRLGAQRGRVFDLDRDLSRIELQEETKNIKTALYGRGKGVEIENESGEGTDVAYGRRLNFADIEWKKANGDPCDKPLGQEWIGDDDALAVWGRDGAHRFDVAIFEDITDPDVLMLATWERLQQVKTPIVTISASVLDMEALWGYAHDAVRLGDDAILRLEKWGADIAARVVELERDYIHPEQTKLVIGDSRLSSSSLLSSLKSSIDGMSSRADVWDRAGAFGENGNLPTDYLQGAIDVLNNRLLSTLSNWYTDPTDGSIMFVAADESSAMRLSGAGWQIADGKISEVWQWRTAGTGTGLVADTITAGVLQASLVKILGTDRFFWDASNIHIIDPANPDREIRIGLYDGQQYGIGYTNDGGASWQNAIGFDGVSFSMSSIPAAYKLEIIATRGVMLSHSVPSTQLMARVYCGSEDITEKTPAARFAWVRISNDSAADDIWNRNHRGMKVVTVTTEDVRVQASFRCDLLAG
ncbi:phage tail protein [Eubacteriales bacterium OttesenSCG-928-A19]|nr:phage tail protein [Eubacteriales bacterium OttesenSCG-928-A19]